MSGLGFNKIAGAVLATGLAIVGLNELSSIIYTQPEPAKAGYAVAVAETAEPGAVAELPVDWGTALPAADVKAGEEVHKKCLSCHNFDDGGPNLIGPNLHGVLGRKPGTHPGFAYSAGMIAQGAAHPVWDYDTIDAFIKAPQADVSGTKMTFVGIKKQQDRINLIAFLRTLSPNAPPIPAPKPAAAAAAVPTNPPGGAAPADAPTSAPPGSPEPAQAPTTGAATAPTANKPSPGSQPG